MMQTIDNHDLRGKIEGGLVRFYAEFTQFGGCRIGAVWLISQAA